MTAIERTHPSVGSSLLLPAAMVGLAMLLMLPREFLEAGAVSTLGFIGVVLVVVLYPGVLGHAAARSDAPRTVLVLGALLFAAPVAISALWTPVGSALDGRQVVLPFETFVVLGLVAVAAMVGATVATQHVRAGEHRTAYVRGAAIEVVVLLFVVSMTLGLYL